MKSGLSEGKCSKTVLTLCVTLRVLLKTIPTTSPMKNVARNFKYRCCGGAICRLRNRARRHLSLAGAILTCAIACNACRSAITKILTHRLGISDAARSGYVTTRLLLPRSSLLRPTDKRICFRPRSFDQLRCKEKKAVRHSFNKLVFSHRDTRAPRPPLCKRDQQCPVPRAPKATIRLRSNAKIQHCYAHPVRLQNNTIIHLAAAKQVLPTPQRAPHTNKQSKDLVCPFSFIHTDRAGPTPNCAQ